MKDLIKDLNDRDEKILQGKINQLMMDYLSEIEERVFYGGFPPPTPQVTTLDSLGVRYHYGTGFFDLRVSG